MKNYRPLVGTRLEDLDTPCLLLYLDAVEHNFKVMADTYKDTSCKLRAHTKNVKAPILAHTQIRTGGTVARVGTAKVSEAEVMIEGGINDILIANQVVTKDKIARLCALARRADMKVCVDNADNIRDLSEIAKTHGVIVGLLIEVDTSLRRAGIRNIEEGVELAKLAHSLPGVKFQGVMSHQHVDEQFGRENRLLEARKYIQMCLDVKDAIEAAGIPVEIVSSGETSTYDVVAEMLGVTEVEGGSYALMSPTFGYLEEFEFAGKVLGTIISTPRPGTAIGDVGILAIMGASIGLLPTVDGRDGVTVESIVEDQILFRDNGTPSLNVGDKFLLIPGHQDTTVNLWDQYIAVRNGVVEAIWHIPGRGCHH